MDMYQKRKMRQEKAKKENKEKMQNQININWYSTNYLNTSEKYCKINIFEKF